MCIRHLQTDEPDKRWAITPVTCRRQAHSTIHCWSCWWCGNPLFKNNKLPNYYLIVLECSAIWFTGLRYQGGHYCTLGKPKMTTLRQEPQRFRDFFCGQVPFLWVDRDSPTNCDNPQDYNPSTHHQPKRVLQPLLICRAAHASLPEHLLQCLPWLSWSRFWSICMVINGLV